MHQGQFTAIFMALMSILLMLFAIFLRLNEM